MTVVSAIDDFSRQTSLGKIPCNLPLFLNNSCLLCFINGFVSLQKDVLISFCVADWIKRIWLITHDQ